MDTWKRCPVDGTRFFHRTAEYPHGRPPGARFCSASRRRRWKLSSSLCIRAFEATSSQCADSEIDLSRLTLSASRRRILPRSSISDTASRSLARSRNRHELRPLRSPMASAAIGLVYGAVAWAFTWFVLVRLVDPVLFAAGRPGEVLLLNLLFGALLGLFLPPLRRLLP